MDKNTMQGLLKQMEQAAETVLLQDAAFLETLQALKLEIDSDRRVQSAVRALQAAGQQVFSSFVPRVRVKIRTEEGLFTLATAMEGLGAAETDAIAGFTQELKNAASAVIMNSRYCAELETIVNEAVTSNQSFERTAAEVEQAGCEVLISLDLSAYAQVRGSYVERKSARPRRQRSPEQTVDIRLSEHDLQFLKAMRIQASPDDLRS